MRFYRFWCFFGLLLLVLIGSFSQLIYIVSSHTQEHVARSQLQVATPISADAALRTQSADRSHTIAEGPSFPEKMLGVPAYDSMHSSTCESPEVLRGIIKSFSSKHVWQKMGARDEERLRLATSCSPSAWERAIEQNFTSENVFRGHVTGACSLESDKVILEQTVRNLQQQLRLCSGPAVVPRTWPLRNTEEERQFCAMVSSVCGQQIPVWVLKPKGGTFGMGVRVQNFSATSQDTCIAALREQSKKGRGTRPYLAQRIVSEPLTLDGLKVELRFHVLIASVKPWLVLYHPSFIVKRATKLSGNGFVVNSHKQKVDSFTAEELAKRLGWGNDALALIQYQLKQIPRLVVAGFDIYRGFSGARHGQWQIYGLDVLLAKDLRAFLLDWNCDPGMGLNVGGKRQSAVTIRDMYRLALEITTGDNLTELKAKALKSSFEVAFDEEGPDTSLLAASCTNQEGPEVSFAHQFQSWLADDKRLDCTSL